MRTILVAALAGHRAARAAVVEQISLPFRSRLLDWSIDVNATDAQMTRRAWIRDLFDCPHCLGFWLTGLTMIVYTVARRTNQRWLCRLVEWWAAAAIQSTLTSRQLRDDAEADLYEAQLKAG